MAARRSREQRSQEAFRGVIEFVDVEVSDYQAALVGISNDFEKRILAIMAEYTVDGGNFVADDASLAKLAKLNQDIEDALEATGYVRRSRRLLERTSELRRRVRDAWRVTLGKRTPFTTADAEAIRLMVGAQFDQYANIGTSGAIAIRDQLTSSVAGEDTWKSATDALKNILIGSGRRDKRNQGMFRHAHTLADTAMAQVQRTMDAQQGKNAEVDTFVYMGPQDRVTRDFCRRLMRQAQDGKVWTRAEIDRLDNSRDAGGAGAGPGSALTQGGGWSCRHAWRPYVPEE